VHHCHGLVERRCTIAMARSPACWRDEKIKRENKNS
jgi:hypothetical protein